MNHKSKRKKYIFVTGGVTSSLGKGLAIASLASLIERRGIRLNMLKMDPYINVDPGTMSPIQHGEVFVTDDGAETDLDLGHYERFTSLTLSRKNNFTTGQVYLQVIENEREGKYLGKTVQVVPHITDEIKRRIHIAAEDADLLLAEIGGTVGDIESQPYLEAIRQFALDVGTENVLFAHLVLLPYIAAAGEVKTKAAQHSVKELRGIGLTPHVIICRTDRDVEESLFEKLSLFCNVPKNNVFVSKDLDSIYKVPIEFHKQGLDERCMELLNIWGTHADIGKLEKVAHNVDHPLNVAKIGIVGKYMELTESYKSLSEALTHGAISNQARFEPVYIDATTIKDDESARAALEEVDGILVPGGFGERGTEGKILAIKYARENNVPFFGICLGMQLAVVEFARHVANIKEASSDEFDNNQDNIIHYMEGQSKDGTKGGSMRLGAYDCQLDPGSKVFNVYGHKRKISERHRHRLEFNNNYRERLEQAGMVFSGINEELNLVEIVELTDHPFFIACQYHPEFKSRPFDPHPLFKSFIEVSMKEKL